MKLSPGSKGLLLALLATLIWSGNFIISRGAAGMIPPVTLAVLRWTCATILVIPIGWRHLKQDWPVIRAHWLYYLIIALFSATGFNTLIYIAGHSTQAVNMSLISTGGTPLFMLVMSRILWRERVYLRQALGMLTAFVGVLVLLTGGDIEVLLSLRFAKGDLWMLVATIMFASYSLLMLRRPGPTSQLGVFTVTFVVGLLCLLPLWLLEIHLDPSFAVPSAAAFLKHWLPLGLYLGGLASLAAFFCWNKAIEYIGAAKAGAIYFTLPAFCGVEALLLLDEPLLPAHFFSAGFIILGVWLAMRR